MIGQVWMETFKRSNVSRIFLIIGLVDDGGARLLDLEDGTQMRVYCKSLFTPTGDEDEAYVKWERIA